MAELVFHPEAQAEYERSLAWYQNRSPREANRFEAEMERVLIATGSNPAMFPKYDGSQRFASPRRAPFSVVYQIQTERVYVVAVAHSRRAASDWRARE
ncbi:MAG: parE2 [Planctomycetota bacterium]|nr:parE2 [Planctomycetota bacterium]